MKISQIKIRKFKDSETKLIGCASITIDELIAIHDIKLLQADKYFLAMPSRMDKKEVFRDVVHPIHSDMREYLQKLLFDAYFKCETTTIFKLKEGCEKELFDITIEDYEVV